MAPQARAPIARSVRCAADPAHQAPALAARCLLP